MKNGEFPVRKLPAYQRDPESIKESVDISGLDPSGVICPFLSCPTNRSSPFVAKPRPAADDYIIVSSILLGGGFAGGFAGCVWLPVISGT